MDRIARCEVWSCLAHDYGLYGIADRLYQMDFNPSFSLRTEKLDEEQTRLYQENEEKAKATGPWSRKIGR